jgi:hypothetical protein
LATLAGIAEIPQSEISEGAERAFLTADAADVPDRGKVDLIALV